MTTDGCNISAEEYEIAVEIENLVHAMVLQSRRIKVSDMISWELDMEVTQNISDADAVANIL